MNTKKEIILGIKSHEEQINNLLNTYDAYLYLVVYDELNQHGKDWHSMDDITLNLDMSFTDVENDDLCEGLHGYFIKDWSSIKSWYLEVWENNPMGNDVLLKTFSQNLNKIELNKDFFVSLMCKVNNCGVDVKNNVINERVADTLFEVAQTLASVADQFEDNINN